MAKTTKTDAKIIASPASFSFEQVIPHALFSPVAASKFSMEHLQIASPFSIRRLSKGNERWYTHEIEGNSDERRYCMSVTTFVGKSMGLDRNLMSYFMQMGKEAADMHLHIAAEYGTYFHIEAGEFLKSGEYDFGYNGFISENKTIEYMEQKLKIPSEKMRYYWIERIQKDMASFITFCEEREVRPVAIECPIVSYEFPLGSIIDLVCQCKFNGKTVNAIIDYKTGEHFYKEHEFQLQLYKRLWNEHFGDIFPVTHIFNWKPCDWDIEKAPTYSFKNQTNSEKISLSTRLQTAIDEGMFNAPKPKFLMEGKYVAGKGQIASHIKLKDYLTLLKSIENENK